jgi:hypothetical protein
MVEATRDKCDYTKGSTTDEIAKDVITNASRIETLKEVINLIERGE